MPTSECNQSSLEQQYQHLRRDWDNYKTSIPCHRRSRSTADLSSSASDFDSEFFQISGKTLKQAKATEIESPLCCGNFTSSSSSLSSHGFNKYEDFSSDNDDDGLEEKDILRGDKRQWIKRLKWFFLGIGAVAVGVCSFGALFGLNDVGQLMTPT